MAHPPQTPTPPAPMPDEDLRTFYVLKVKGKAKIPDYLQVRDERFTLVGYYRPGRDQSGGRKPPKQVLFETIEQLMADAPYGQVQTLRLAVPADAKL